MLRISPIVSLLIVATLVLSAVSCQAPTAPATSAPPSPTAASAPSTAPATAAPAAATTVAPAPAPTAAPAAKVNMSMSGVGSTSGHYMYAVALAKAINSYCPAVNMTVLECGGGEEGANGVVLGKWDIVHNLDPNYAQQVLAGTSAVGKPFPIRLLWLRSVTWKPLVVTKESGVKTFSDLAGKKFNPGIPGSVAYSTFLDSVDATGVKVDIYDATLEEAKKAMQDRQIVGMCKSSPYNALDKSVVEVNLTMPLTVVGYTKAQVDQIYQKYPKYLGQYLYKPKGFLKEFPEAGDFYIEEHGTATMGSTNISPEIAYCMVKAVHENWQEVVAAYSASGEVDPVKDLILQYKDVGVPLHAGVVKYCKEKGFEVPASLIPEEYKP